MPDGIVLYPHFQKAVVPGWLDKGLKWRHKPTGFLDRMVVLAPNPEWIKAPAQRQAAGPQRLHALRQRRCRRASRPGASRRRSRSGWRTSSREWLHGGSERDVLPL